MPVPVLHFLPWSSNTQSWHGAATAPPLPGRKTCRMKPLQWKNTVRSWMPWKQWNNLQCVRVGGILASQVSRTHLLSSVVFQLWIHKPVSLKPPRGNRDYSLRHKYLKCQCSCFKETKFELSCENIHFSVPMFLFSVTQVLVFFLAFLYSYA